MGDNFQDYSVIQNFEADLPSDYNSFSDFFDDI